MVSRLACAFALFCLSLSFTASAQLKGDPWIFQAYKELYKRDPNALELNINLYNNGSWNNYGELKTYIQAYQSSLTSNNLTITISALNGTTNVAALINQDGKTIAADVISQDAGKIVAAGGGNIVAAGGGNIVAAGGGNLKDVAGFSVGATRTLMSGESRIIKTSGKGAIIIRK